MDLRDLAVGALAQNRRTALLLGTGAALLLGLVLVYKRTRKTEKSVRVGAVSQIFIHPLKSGRARPVARAECQKMCLKSGEMLDR
uniref:Uncharacterized protein n=1 Tax=Oryzias sinensis TaxID=183150 RepID=A0A8C7YDQ8_9TELE